MQDAAATAAPFRNLEAGLAAAQDARNNGDLVAALGIYSELRRLFPGHAEPFQRAATALVDAVHYEEADVLLEVAQERFPTDPGLAIDYAWVAHRRLDVAEALRRWERVRSGFPDHPGGYTGAAVTLRDARQFDAAEVLLRAAQERFPDSPELIFELAWMAVARRDWAEAASRWDAVRSRFPDHWLGFFGGAVALRDAGRFAEAEALLLTAIDRFPDQPQIAIDYAAVAAARRDWPEALRRWEKVAERFPGRIESHTSKALALREMQRFEEAEAELAVAAERWPRQPAIAVDRAWLAHIRRGWPEAVRRWEIVRQILPASPAGFINGAMALREAGRAADADALLMQAIDRQPDSIDLLREYARLAQAGGDWSEAVRRWETLRNRFPDAEAGYVEAAISLRELGQLDAAETLLRQGMARLPDQPRPVIELGWLLQRRRALAAAIELWAGVRQRFPDQIAGYTGGAQALRDSNRLEEATALLLEAQQRFPDEADPLIEQGWLAHASGERTAAVQRFTTARERFPDHPVATLGLARALAASGQFDAADAVLREGVARFPWFSLLAEDAAGLPALRAAQEPAEVTPMPEPPPATPQIAPRGVITLAVWGYHLANQVSQIFARLPALRGRIVVHRIDAGADFAGALAGLPEQFLETADLYFEESMVGLPPVREQLRAALPQRCDIRGFASPSMQALWPFLGADARRVPEPRVYHGARYPYADRIAARLANLDLTDDALFDAYLALTEAEAPDLDAMLAEDVARWEAEDQRHEVKLAAFLRDTFRTSQLFTTPHERGADVLRAIVLQLFAVPALRDGFDPAVLRASLDRLTLGWRATRQGLPVHPLVARHFGLQWWSPDMRYRMLGNTFTFRDFILRYIRWSAWLP